jgi:hypothetical protein
MERVMTEAAMLADETTAAMATVLRTKRVCLVGAIVDVEDRAFDALWTGPGARGRGWSNCEIKPRLTAAIRIARDLGPINIDAGAAA